MQIDSRKLVFNAKLDVCFVMCMSCKILKFGYESLDIWTGLSVQFISFEFADPSLIFRSDIPPWNCWKTEEDWTKQNGNYLGNCRNYYTKRT